MLPAVCSSALFLSAVEWKLGYGQRCFRQCAARLCSFLLWRVATASSTTNGLLYNFTVFQTCSAVPCLHVLRFCRKREGSHQFFLRGRIVYTVVEALPGEEKAAKVKNISNGSSALLRVWCGLPSWSTNLEAPYKHLIIKKSDGVSSAGFMM